MKALFQMRPAWYTEENVFRVRGEHSLRDPDNVNVRFGNELRKMREARRYTQEEFAQLCGISRAYYGRLERGEHSVTLERCKQIADALNLTLSDLFINLPD